MKAASTRPCADIPSSECSEAKPSSEGSPDLRFYPLPRTQESVFSCQLSAAKTRVAAIAPRPSDAYGLKALETVSENQESNVQACEKSTTFSGFLFGTGSVRPEVTRSVWDPLCTVWESLALECGAGFFAVICLAFASHGGPGTEVSSRLEVTLNSPPPSWWKIR